MTEKFVSCPAGSSSIYLYNGIEGVRDYTEDCIQEIPPMHVDLRNVGFLMDAAVIPSPGSPYRELSVLNAGDSVDVGTNNELSFSEEFKFLRRNSSAQSYSSSKFETILVESVLASITPGTNVVLFLSGGKDSVALACALAELKGEVDVHCLIYRSDYQDESTIASQVAKKLGLSYEVVSIDDYSVNSAKMDDYFQRQLIPSLDLCSTVYLHCDLERYKGCTLMDGMGNDLHLGHIPGLAELKAARYQAIIPYWMKRVSGSLRRRHNLFLMGSKTRSEMVGMWSLLSSSRVIDVLMPFKERREFWEEIDQKYSNEDYLDLRAALRGRYIDQEKFIRKIKNATSAYDMHLALPWTNPILANYCHSLSDAELFDRAALKNKMFIRQYLTDKLDIDYFNEKKFTFSYNVERFVIANQTYVRDSIINSELFNKQLLVAEYELLLRQRNYGALYQLFLLLSWHNLSGFIAR